MAILSVVDFKRTRTAGWRSSKKGDVKGRSVSLLVCDPEGHLLGTLDAFDVPTPWWPDVEPICQRIPTVRVLRLLEGTREPGEAYGGHVTYLVEVDDPTGLALREAPAELDALLAEHRLRMPWARPGGPTADLAWAYQAASAAGLEPTGPPSQHRTWNLSAISSIPVKRIGHGRGKVWLKCVPGFFRHEAEVLRLLHHESVPELIASDGHRMLLAELPGRDGFGASPEEAMGLIEQLVGLQHRTAPLVPSFLAAGVPDAREGPLVEELTSLVERRAPGDPALRRLLESAPRRFAIAESCGLPPVLVHGDAHPGNARVGTEPPVFFDWGDSRIGSPLLDIAVLDLLDRSLRESLTDHWLRAWEEVVPGSAPRRAWEALRPLASLRLAAVYQAFLDDIEPTERVYHADDVQPALAIAAEVCEVGDLPA